MDRVGRGEKNDLIDRGESYKDRDRGVEVKRVMVRDEENRDDEVK